MTDEDTIKQDLITIRDALERLPGQWRLQLDGVNFRTFSDVFINHRRVKTVVDTDSDEPWGGNQDVSMDYPKGMK